MSWFEKSVIIIFLILYGLLILQPINLTAVDLGRHIKNGEMILQGDYRVLYQNLYSYTNPDFPFVNHHWLSGVVFYLAHQVVGFTGLSLVFLVISLLTLWLFFDLAKRNSDFFIATLATIVLFPMLISRTEIRPEIFSYLFLGIYFFLLHRPRSKLVWFLIPLQVLWVNLHVYFFMGIGLIGLFWLNAVVLKQKEMKKLSVILVSIVGISLINPFGLKGLLYPFLINQNYGYRVLENQNLWFLLSVIQHPMVIFFGLGFLLLWGSFIYKFWTERRKITNFFLVYLFLAVGMTIFGFLMLRNVIVFALFALPIISFNLRNLTKKYTFSTASIFSWLTIYILVGVGLLVMGPSFWQNRQFGVWLYPGIEKSANFFKENNLKGPIFNNYDIGSFLVYELYPEEKVFTDNRPEAYPANFFQNDYIPAQENTTKWDPLDSQYHFNIIFFYLHDLTPWAQKFLINKVKDPDWAPIYVDDFSIIFIKRNSQNESIIKQFEIPKEKFNIK